MMTKLKKNLRNYTQVTYTKEEINNPEETASRQSASHICFGYRKYRLTISNFGGIVKRMDVIKQNPVQSEMILQKNCGARYNYTIWALLFMKRNLLCLPNQIMSYYAVAGEKDK